MVAKFADQVGQLLKCVVPDDFPSTTQSLSTGNSGGLDQYDQRRVRRVEARPEEVATTAGVSVRTIYNAADGINSNRGTRKLIAAALDTSVEAL